MNKLLVAGFIAIGLAHFVGVQAKTCVWTGGGTDTKWSTEANWESGNVPADGDEVSMTVVADTPYDIVNDLGDLTLANFTFVNTGASFATLRSNPTTSIITITGTFEYENQTTGKVTLRNYQNYCLAPGSQLNVRATGNALYTDGELTGSGRINKYGSSSFTANHANKNFSGDWYIYQGGLYVFGEATSQGSGTIYVYGQNKTLKDENNGALQFKRNVIYPNEIHLYHHTSVTALYPEVVLTGDVYCHTGHKDEQCRLATAKDGTNEGGIDFQGKVIVDPEMKAGYVTLYLDHKPQFLRFSGGVSLEDRNFAVKAGGGIVYFNSKIESTQTESPLITPGLTNVLVVCEKEDVLPHTCRLGFGTSKDNELHTRWDLNGFDQTIGTLYASYPNAESLAANPAATNDTILTSDAGPATLTVTAQVGLNSTHPFDRIDGHLSLRFEGSPEKYITVMQKAGSVSQTDGKITIGGNYLIYLRGQYPNISEIEVIERGIAYMDDVPAIDAMNPNVVFNLHDRTDPDPEDEHTPRTNGYLSVTSGGELHVARVMVDDIDWSEGTWYKRTNSGNQRTRVYWMGSGTGATVIPSLDYRWVWTGNGDGTSVSDAANWATNVAPDLASGHTILDFKYAKGSTAFDIDGAWNIAGLMTEADGALYTFGGNGSLTIGGSENCLANAKLTDALAVTYAGAGRQTFAKGVSDTTGALTVSSGTLALADGASLTGAANVSIAASAKLDLADGVAAKANTLELDGNAARRGVWGSSASSAARVDDAHFSGLGTLEALHSNLGTLLLFR